MADANFMDGIIAKRHEKAPDFVIVNLSFKTAEFIKYLQDHDKNGWVNGQVKRSKKGKLYCELDTWEKGSTDKEDKKFDTDFDKANEDAIDISEPAETTIDYPTEEINPEDIPF